MTPDAGVEIFAVMRMMMRRIFVADFRSAAPRIPTGVDISGVVADISGVPVTTGDAEVFGRKSDGFAGFDDAMLDDRGDAEFQNCTARIPGMWGK